MPGIIVGVDGSDNSRLALAWAMREAVRHRVPLTAITVLPPPVYPATRMYWSMPELPDASLDTEPARRMLRELADKAAAELGDPAPEVTVNVLLGDPAEELIRESGDAHMLVVGSRGDGGFTRLLLGSVSSKVTHHAACPVAIIPAGR